MQNPKTPRLLRRTPAVVAFLLTAYVTSYLFVRQQHLMLEYIGKTRMFSSTRELKEFSRHYDARYRESMPLAYREGGLFLFYYPLIRLDSAISGRPIHSPFGSDAKPYVVPGHVPRGYEHEE